MSKQLFQIRWEKDRHLQTTNCNLCQADDSYLLAIENGFRIVKCKQCGLVYINPRPQENDLVEFYQQYFPENETSPERWRQMMAAIFKEVYQRILKRSIPGRILDIGCSYGFFLEQFKGAGWGTYGLELSKPAATFAEERLGLRVFQGSLFQQKWPDGYFDVITLFYVLEHVIDPTGFLQEIYRLLKPDGLLFLRVPHSEPLVRLAKALRLEIPLLYPPMHLYDFSPFVLRRFLLKTGFKDISPEIGKCTRMEGFIPRSLLQTITALSISIHYLSQGRFLMPGLSKNIYAVKK